MCSETQRARAASSSCMCRGEQLSEYEYPPPRARWLSSHSQEWGNWGPLLNRWSTTYGVYQFSVGVEEEACRRRGSLSPVRSPGGGSIWGFCIFGGYLGRSFGYTRREYGPRSGKAHKHAGQDWWLPGDHVTLVQSPVKLNWPPALFDLPLDNRCTRKLF